MSKKLNLQEHLEPAAHSDQPRKPQTSGVSCQAGTQAFSVVKHTTANAKYIARPSYLGVGRALGWVGRSHGDAQVALFGGDIPNHAEVALLTPALAPAVLDQPVRCACLVLRAAPSANSIGMHAWSHQCGRSRKWCTQPAPGRHLVQANCKNSMIEPRAGRPAKHAARVKLQRGAGADGDRHRLVRHCLGERGFAVDRDVLATADRRQGSRAEKRKFSRGTSTTASTQSIVSEQALPHSRQWRPLCGPRAACCKRCQQTSTGSLSRCQGLRSL